MPNCERMMNLSHFKNILRGRFCFRRNLNTGSLYLCSWDEYGCWKMTRVAVLLRKTWSWINVGYIRTTK